MLPFSIHPANAPERRIAVRSPDDGAAVVLADLPPDDPRGLWYADPGGFICAVPDPDRRRLYLTVLNSVGGSPVCISYFTGNDDQRWTVQLGGSQLASVRYPGMVVTNHECDPDAYNPVVIFHRASQPCQRWQFKELSATAAAALGAAEELTA